ncbi:VOC family protein [Exilibacterium tricleocarpae]|uniref:VOC family protein n=1 Tax=Exilibacterium tricleocarpae TaxID=2591008 RepID=A0A545SMU9_9GAMM|nr:VOC family protein [Exilibacterium tricleocarpae]TQV66318.1 VOC family protein [Exilibacterium tricleocarpae]
MSQSERPVISHVSIGTNNFEKATAFYDRVMASLGFEKTMEYPGAAAYGRDGLPIFWVQTPADGEDATVGNGTHIAFDAQGRDMVHKFYEAAIAAGAQGQGEPGPRADYGDAYYGCFVRDLDGHKIEATWWDMSKM